MARRFGEIDGFPPGSWFPDRHSLAAARVHTPLQKGISGDREFGAESIVLSGGYEDDEDFGDVILYTGQGGNEGGRQVAPQALLKGNLALARSCVIGRPVRVIRGARHVFRRIPDLRVDAGYRYDGLYRVESFWRSAGRSGLPIWRFRLIRLPQSDAQDREAAGVAEDSPPYDRTDGPLARYEATIQRLARNTEMAIAVKAIYSSRCQVCGTTVTTPAGDYAEAAHIRPLGSPHDGPDHPSNLLCLCPNHHVMFDLGGFVIRDDLTLMNPTTGELLGRLHAHPDHVIERAHLAYHRSLFSDDVVVPFEPESGSFRGSTRAVSPGQRILFDAS